MEVLLEVLLYLGGEFLIDAIARFWPAGKAERNVYLGILGYAVLGAGIGMLTLWLVPHHLIPSRNLRIVSLIVAPVLAAGVMAWIGSMSRRKNRRVVRIEEFVYAYTTALTVAVMRYFWAD